MNRRGRGGFTLAVLLLAGLASGCNSSRTTTPAPTPTAATALDLDTSASNIVTVDVGGGIDPSYGATPMAERVATLGLLNKRNGASRDIVLKPGKSARVGAVVVHLKACEQTAPWEQEHYTGAFVQVDVEASDGNKGRSWRRIFSGWLFKERPALNVVQHPIYDVWVKNCAMAFPEGGPDSVSGAAGPDDSAPPRSSAKKSPASLPDPPAPTTPEIAPDNDDR